jgi:HEAT repeat protein
MPLFILIVALVAILMIWWLKSDRALNRNEKLYLKRRGYAVEDSVEARTSVSPDTRLFAAIESLNDLSPASRQRAAQNLAQMCEQGSRDSIMFSALLEALNDSDAAVRSAVVTALEKFGDVRVLEFLEKRLEIEEALQTRAALQRVIKRLKT